VSVCVSVWVCVRVQADAAHPAATAALVEHLQFIESLNVSGVSHHNLLYSTAEEAPPPLSEAELRVSATESHCPRKAMGRETCWFGDVVMTAWGQQPGVSSGFLRIS
jgi:hypothetical protein